MKINLKKDENLNKDDFYIEIKYSNETQKLQDLVNYISDYNFDYRNKVIVLDDDYTLIEITLENIIMFYSNKRYNYCKTKNKNYRVKSKLYELEKINVNFIRISKNCIVNIKHVEKFDIGETGKIIVKLDDNTEEIVSRRRTQTIMKYLEDRRI